MHHKDDHEQEDLATLKILPMKTIALIKIWEGQELFFLLLDKTTVQSKVT